MLNLCLASTRRWRNVGLMLAHRLRRWPNIDPTLGHRLVFAGYSTSHYIAIHERPFERLLPAGTEWDYHAPSYVGKDG